MKRWSVCMQKWKVESGKVESDKVRRDELHSSLWKV